jgi:hypothetical protein
MIERVYKMSRQARLFSLLLLSLGTFSSVEFLTGVLAVNYRHARLMIMGIVLLVIGAFATAITFTSRITLSDKAIELHNILWKKRMLISEIRGRSEIVRASSKGMTSTWKLVPMDVNARTLALSNSFAFDEVFYEWLNRIPVLDAEDVS